MNNNDSRILIRETYLSILPAQLLAALIPYLSGIINGLVIGNCYSSNMLAVIGFSTPVVYFLSAVRTLFSIGAGATSGNFMGQGRLAKVNETYRLCIRSLVMTGLVMTLLIMVFTSSAAGMLAKDSELLPETEDYLRGLAVGFVPCLLIPFLSVFLQLAGSSRKVVVSSVMNASLNLIFDLAAVKIFNAGIMGIGLATSLAQLVCAVYLIISIRGTGFVKFSMEPSDIRILGNVFRFGINSCMLLIMETFRNSTIVRQSLLTGGIAASAATSLLFSSSGIVDFITSGFMSSSGMVASLYAGEENEDSLRMTAVWGMVAGGAAGLASGILLLIFAEPVAIAFGAKQTELELSVICLRTYAAYIMIANPLQVILRVYQCLKRVKLNFAIMFAKEIMIAVPLVFILGNRLGPRGIWMCFPLSTAAAILIVIAVSMYMCRRQGRDHMDLIWYNEGETFTDSENYYLSGSDEVYNVLHGIEGFCRRNDTDKKSRLACRLLAEENIRNLLEHGASAGRNRGLKINVFIGTDGRKTRLVFQDNSSQFDPLKRFRVYDETDDELLHDASVSIVKSIANNISYQFSFGMNILMIDLLHEAAAETGNGK